jgi:hypothetical protein
VAAGRTPAIERAINTYSVIADDSAKADALAAETVGEMFYNQPDFHARTLVGNPDRWHERLTEWRSLGLTYCELKPIYSTVDELIAQMRMVSEEIMPAFQDPPRA